MNWYSRIIKEATADPTSMSKEDWLKSNMPGMTFDQMLEEPNYSRYLSLKKEWQRAMERALSTGRLSPEDAGSKKFLFEPGHGPLPTEPLYHVTTARDAIVSGGIKTRDELGQSLGKGLGGGQSNTISFTIDLNTARGIRDNMLEARAFASGELSFDDLYRMAEKGTGAKRPWLEEWLKYHGSKDGKTTSEGVKAILEGYELDPLPMPKTKEEMSKEGWEPVPSSRWTHGREEYEGYTLFRRRLSPEKEAERKFEFFKTWSSFRDVAGGPLDPLYFLSDPTSLASVPKDQVAILEFRAKPKGYGHRVSALGEWRTYSGDAVEFVRVVS